MNAEKNAIYLRRKSNVLLSTGSGRLSLAHLASLLKNIQTLGFTFSPSLLVRLRTCTEQEAASFVDECVTILQSMVGANVQYRPLFPNFPRDIMAADDAVDYLRAVLGEAIETLGFGDVPAPVERSDSEWSPATDLVTIDLGSEEEFTSLFRGLMGAKTSISAQDKDDVLWSIQQYSSDLRMILPASIPHKENLGFVTAALLKHTNQADELLEQYYRVATDILRLAVAMSEGDVSLAEPCRFRTFKRPERRLLLGLIEQCPAPVEDMLRFKKRWIRLGEKLHPGEYAKRFPKAAEAFHILRNNLPFETFLSQVERLIVEKDVVSAVALLSKRPGILARRLDQLLRLGDEQALVCSTFRDVASSIATPVLLQVMAHFENRTKQQAVRAFFPKGNVAKVCSVPNELPVLSEDVCRELVSACREALLARFAELEPLDNVYVDESLRHCLVPFSQRSASKALRTLVRGSRLPIPEGDTIRFFLWWKEGEVGGKHTGRVDVDLSAVMYDAEWSYKEHISYTNLKSSKYRAAHSGDITSAPNGACEFIDLDIPSILKYGGRYVIMSVLSYTGQAFCDMPECHAGWMMRQEPASKEVFAPRDVVDKVDLSADSRICVPVILDLQERQLIWADLALRSHPHWVINVESNRRGFVEMGRAITTLAKPDLHTLFSLHGEARGHLVDVVDDADTIFSMQEGITPFDFEEIIANFL